MAAGSGAPPPNSTAAGSGAPPLNSTARSLCPPPPPQLVQGQLQHRRHGRIVVGHRAIIGNRRNNHKVIVGKCPNDPFVEASRCELGRRLGCRLHGIVASPDRVGSDCLRLPTGVAREGGCGGALHPGHGCESRVTKPGRPLSWGNLCTATAMDKKCNDNAYSQYARVAMASR